MDGGLVIDKVRVLALALLLPGGGGFDDDDERLKKQKRDLSEALLC
jgi:hypothetical protein